MKGRAPTKADKEHMSRVVNLGCIICSQFYDYLDVPCEIHHVIGKTKPGAHRMVLPLCVTHHRGGSDEDGHVSRHPYKKRFETRYASETDLLKMVKGALNDDRD